MSLKYDKHENGVFRDIVIWGYSWGGSPGSTLWHPFWLPFGMGNAKDETKAVPKGYQNGLILDPSRVGTHE